jgi:hypothetical protein
VVWAHGNVPVVVKAFNDSEVKTEGLCDINIYAVPVVMNQMGSWISYKVNGMRAHAIRAIHLVN